VFNYSDAFASNILALKKENRYRHFAEIQRDTTTFPIAQIFKRYELEDVTIWCSNDYLGQGCNPVVLDAVCDAVRTYGAGAGGTRNISGNSPLHRKLECELADWHNKEAALLFTSGYVANDAALSTIARLLPNCIIFSDQKNHASMIEGIRHSGVDKHIFEHNNVEQLETLLKRVPVDQPKIIAFESVYSMDGDFGPIDKIVALAKKYGALTYLDEVHAVGMYGPSGSGVADKLGLAGEIDIIQATLGKAIGCIGGYIAGNRTLIDVVRSHAAGFIFTTSLPPAVVTGALVSVRYLRGPEGQELRKRHQHNAKILKESLLSKRLPIVDSPSHIIPLIVGDAGKCMQVTESLLENHKIYIQPINYPTVAKGSERLRITATPFHNEEKIHQLTEALDTIWNDLHLQRRRER